MKLVAYTQKVIVTPVEKKKESEGGIITDSAKPADEGIVVAKGPKVESDLKVGDKVAFNEYAGKSYKIDGTEYICLHENELYCGIEE
jgi:chaperonin GroES